MKETPVDARKMLARELGIQYGALVESAQDFARFIRFQPDDVLALIRFPKEVKRLIDAAMGLDQVEGDEVTG